MAFRTAAALAALSIFAAAGAASAASNDLCKGISSDPIDPSYLGNSGGPSGDGYDFINAVACLGVFNGDDRSTSASGDTVGITATTATTMGDDLRTNVSTTNTDAFGRSDEEHNEAIINSLNAFGFSDWDLVAENTSTLGTTTYSANTALGSSYAFATATYNTNGAAANDAGTWTVGDFQDAQRAAIVMMTDADQWAIYLLDSAVDGESGFWTTRQQFDATDGYSRFKQTEGFNLNSMQLYISTAVPVPAAAPLLLAGLGALAWVRRRKA